MSTIRARRRCAGQRHALTKLQRDLSATDPNFRLKYLRDYQRAFRAYESVLSQAQMDDAIASVDILLVGDYHALPQSQEWAATLIAKLAAAGRPVAFGLETVFARDQQILEEWRRREIEDNELRERMRYDAQWGYAWEPFIALLRVARQHCVGIYGLDCMPRHDMRKISARDRHAAAKIAEIRERHPEAAVVALFGESHLAPNHLPMWLRERGPDSRVLTILQNVDDLYWRAAGERREKVEAVRVNAGTVCVFNATPLEKYESYRQCIERWRQERTTQLDYAPTVYNLVDALLSFLNVPKYSATNGTQPRFLVDRYPEVYGRGSMAQLRKLLGRKSATPAETATILERVADHGCCYVPRMNAFFIYGFSMAGAAEEVSRFVHLTCSGLGAHSRPPEDTQPENTFYLEVWRDAVARVGSRVIHPHPSPSREHDIYALYAQPRASIEGATLHSYEDYMRMLDFLALHKDFENNARHYFEVPGLLQEGLGFTGEKRRFVAERLANILANEVHDAYISGTVSKRFLRGMFFRKLESAKDGRDAYFETAGRVSARRREAA